MHNLVLIEEYYKKNIQNLFKSIPEDIYFINIELLNHFDLLHFRPPIERKEESSLIPYFQVNESPEKITLVNDEFIVWITPDKAEHTFLTYTLIALNREKGEPQLEAAFIASGVYNNSKLVLRVLEKFLIEIKETENILSKIQ